MNALEDAFLDTDFNWVTSLKRIWTDTATHVPDLQADVADAILRDFKRLNRPRANGALGKVVTGGAGSGKTHFIGELRRRVWEANGWFVFIDIVGLTDFWKTTVLSFIVSLRQTMPNGLPQYESVFKSVLRTIPEDKLRGVDVKADDLGMGAIATVNLFIKLLRSAYPNEISLHSDVVRALLMQRDPDMMDIAYAWLLGLDIDVEDRQKLGLAAAPPAPVSIVRSISWLMSLSGPTMIAIDQIDAIVSASNITQTGQSRSEGEGEAKARAIIEMFAGGLLDLREQTSRSMTILSCLGETWSILENSTLRSASQRFSLPPHILSTKDYDPARIAALVQRRLAVTYAENGVVPPTPIWPFNATFCDAMTMKMPREILMACEQFRHLCLRNGKVEEWPGGHVVVKDDTATMEVAFSAARQAADIADMMIANDDSGPLGELLRDSLKTYIDQFEWAADVDVVVAQPEERKPILHARLTFVFRGEGDLEKHYCFRALGQTNARAVQPRLRAAMDATGIDHDLPFRHLFVLRNDPMPTGRVTGELVAAFEAAGGIFVAPTDDDLRTFVALRSMVGRKSPGFHAWLKTTRPLCDTAFFKAVGLCPPPLSSTEPPTQPPWIAPPTPPTGIPVGVRLEGGGLGPSVDLPIALLTRHTAIFAGSGSGKTVLLRRIVEEAALAGIPAIVLDTNNDLARLGTAWPSRPEAFSAVDLEKAARYARVVEVVVWTPGVTAGRPLTLAVLPDFAAVAAGDERDDAVAMAWATLAPLVGATGSARVLKEGLLKEALAAFAREGRTGIEAFVDFLADLPDGVSRQSRATTLANQMSDQLRAKIAVNPLLNARGQPLDPAVLFKADRAGATRISVINFAGLPDLNRQDFVNQLQMALFTFIKRSPSKTPRLYVVDEAQNFAPSQGATASKASAKALAAQARKFGLGMIFATQAPKGIDTTIVSNCVTHFYGRMSSPALIDATEDMMAARGKAARDLGTLSAGMFYVSTEDMSRPAKIKTPLCLSYHPQNPATPEEVLALAKRGPPSES